MPPYEKSLSLAETTINVSSCRMASLSSSCKQASSYISVPARQVQPIVDSDSGTMEKKFHLFLQSPAQQIVLWIMFRISHLDKQQF
jgi:hypothetical protein